MARRRTPIFAAVDDALLSSGLQPDRHTLKRALWESAANVTFWNGLVRRKIPPAQAFSMGTPAKPIRGLAQQNMSDGRRIIWAAANDRVVGWLFGPTFHINLPAPFGVYVADVTATQRPTFYDLLPYGDWLIINPSYPGVAAKIFKAGSPLDFPTFGNAPTGVTKFLKMLSFVVAVGYGPRGTQVGVSDSQNIENWTSGSTTTAASISIDEFNTPIRSAAKMADAISVFSEDQMALVRYIGAPFILGQKTILDGIGAIGKMAVASDTKVNVGMSRAGAWWTDGNSVRYIDEGYISNYFQDNVNWSQGAKIVVGRNDYTGCFEFHMPMGVSMEPNEAWSWDPKTGGWSPVRPFTMFDERRLFEHVLYGDVVDAVFLGDFNTQGHGDLILETKPIVMSTAESPHVVVRMDEFDLLAHKASKVQVSVGCAQDPNGDWQWSAWESVVAGLPLMNVSADEEAPYWKLRLRNEPGKDDWTLDFQGFLFYGEVTGTKP
jgi:hypothetical protein